MSDRKKKPVQYFFVDINDPDYYKRIKVARACIDCRKRKSKCDIGKPGSGPCSSCRKHNKVCEFTTISSSVQSLPLSSSASEGSSSVPTVARTTTIQWTEETQDYHVQRKDPQQPRRRQRRSHLVSHRLALSTPRSSTQADIECNWTPHELTLLPFTVPVDSNVTTDNNHQNNNNNNNTSQSTVTQEEHHLVGHLRLNLPVLCVQKEYNQTILTHPPSSLPVPSPTLLSSHSTSSPPFFRNHANGATFQWKTSNAELTGPNLEISMHSVSLVDPVSYLSTTTTTTACSSTPAACATDSLDLFELYFEKIHPSFPVLPHPLPLKLRSAPLGDAIQAVALLHTATTIELGQEYSTKAWEGMQARGTDDLVTAQTLLVLYKYYETIGEEARSVLESAQAILETLQQDDEWVCRLQWIVYLNQGSWRDPPLIRLPCVLRCEQEDQAKAIALLLENIQMACVYTSAMQSLATVDPWEVKN